MTDTPWPPARPGASRAGADDVRGLALLAHRLGGCTTLDEVHATGTAALRDLLAATVVGMRRVQQDEWHPVAADPAGPSDPADPNGPGGPREVHEVVAAVLAADEVRAALIRREQSWFAGTRTGPGASPGAGPGASPGAGPGAGPAAGSARPALAAPVVVNGALWGALVAVRDAGATPFDPDDAARAEVLAALVGAHVARLDLTEQVRHLVSDDPLTGLGTRRVADEAARRAIDTGDETCIVMCDVDGLKRVNDDLGHDAGDDLLRAVAAVLRRAGSGLPGSTTARIGGDEFCIVTSGIPRTTVAQVMESTVGDAPLPHGASLSYGIASSARGSIGAAPTPRSLFRRADAAQYHAKRSHAAARARQYRADDPGVVLGRTVAAGVTALSGAGTGVLTRLCALAAATTEAMGGSGWAVRRDLPTTRTSGTAGHGPTAGADDAAEAHGGTGSAGTSGEGTAGGGPAPRRSAVVARGGTSSVHADGIRPLRLHQAPWTVDIETTLSPDDRTVGSTLGTLVALGVAGGGTESGDERGTADGPDGASGPR